MIKKFTIFTLLIPFFIDAQETYILNYDDVDLKKVTQDVASFSNKTLILDPRVKGRVSIFSDTILTSQQVWEVYLRTIQVSGFSAISDGDIVRIVPENDATRDDTDISNDGDFTTKIIPLVNRSAGGILPMLKPITGRQSYLSSIPSVNSILIVDKLSNVQRIETLIDQLDKDNSAGISIIKLENLSSIEAVRILERLKLQENPTINNFIAVPFPTSNSVILSANNFVTNNITQTLEALDKDALNDSSVAVIYLKYAKAEEVSTILNTVSARFSNSESSEKPVVTFHEKTNSIIVSTEQANLDVIRNLISKLDIRRAQVLVEAIIVELSETAAKSLGVETVFAGGEDGDVPLGITRFQNSNSPDLLALAGSAAESGNDVTLRNIGASSLLNTQGLIAGVGSIDSNGDSFATIISAIANDQDSNILSTPSVIAMDNEQANLVIGQEIPITTGESLGANNANPFRTTSRQEVGIKLSIVPQINEGNSVILNINQEVSGVVGPLTGTADLITNKRTIETTVLVDNNQVIVLGGLIDDDIQSSESRVPFLGAIPVVGNLFKTSSQSRVKRNLLVFIRPTILFDSNDVMELSNEKYNYIEAARLLDGAKSDIIDLTIKP
ncbi:MAG: type II secretion system protein GspD [Gammaproteobacteria bacterium TMED104]|nr:MAG: type II secretion system protein GspD [Gammaproteobacteria bacterium TMED104]